MNRRRASLTIAGCVGALALVALAVFAPRAAAGGWLIAFVVLSAIPLGALALIMIHNLTGGAWGEDLRPTLEPAAACAILLAPLFVPVLLALPRLYPWVEGSTRVPPDVARLYLNTPLFVLRAAVAFAGWGALALLLPLATGRARVLLSGLGLIFHAIAVTLLATDLVLSADPAFISSSFGATTAFVQLYSALAFVAVSVPPGLRRKGRRDLAGLILTVALGTTYINFMAVLVIWYGDVPLKVSWFVERTAVPLNFVAAGAFLIGSLVPILALMLARLRESVRALRWIGGAALGGIALYNVWLLAPALGGLALPAAILAGVVIACALLLLATRDAGAPLSPQRSGYHG
jgi:hypothetical protein